MGGKLSQILAPTLVIWGDQDRIIDVSASKRWRAGLLNAELHVLKGIGDAPMLEQPEVVAGLVQDFFARNEM